MSGCGGIRMMGLLISRGVVVGGAKGSGLRVTSLDSLSLLGFYCSLLLPGWWAEGFNDASYRAGPPSWECILRKLSLAFWILGPLIFLIVTIKAVRTPVSARASASSAITSKPSPGGQASLWAFALPLAGSLAFILPSNLTFWAPVESADRILLDPIAKS